VDENLLRFLRLVPTARWEQAPRIWGEQIRRALNDGLVKVGGRNILTLTDAGKAAIK
jgi:hypothetical protein